MGGEIPMTPEEIDAKIAEYSAMIADPQPGEIFPERPDREPGALSQDQIRMLQQAKRLLDGVAISSAQVGEHRCAPRKTRRHNRLVGRAGQPG